MTTKTILIVDNNPESQSATKKNLGQDPLFDKIITAVDERDCYAKLSRENIDLVVLNYSLGKVNGLQVMKEITNQGYELPIVMVFTNEHEKFVLKAIQMGICDFLVKSDNTCYSPILAITIKKCLHHQHVLQRKQELEKRQHEDFMNTISTLAALIEIKDPYTGGHSRTVRDLSLAIANRLNLSKEQVEQIEIAAFLHDIGKIGVPGKILNKAEQLTTEEYKRIQQHVELGFLALKHVRKMEKVSDIIKHHHEAYNGHGYPDGLNGKEIPLGARIIHITDSYSAMTSNRPYRPAMPKQEVLAELERGSGKEYDPYLLDIFFQILWEHLEIISKENSFVDVCLRTYIN